MQTSIQLVPTNKPHIFKIYLTLDKETKQIGKLDSRAEGKLLLVRKQHHLFRKTNSVAVNYSLLHDSSIRFRDIEISFNGKKYYSTREYFIKKGKPFQFTSKGFELQLFVPLDELNINTIKRFEDSNWFQSDMFNQVA